MSKHLRGRRSVIILVVITFIFTTIPGQSLFANSRGNAYVEMKGDANDMLNVMSILNVGGDAAAGAGDLIAIFDICDAIVFASEGRYNDSMTIMLKVGLTTFFKNSIGPLATSLDVGKLLRDSTVTAVFEPGIKKHYQEYRDRRIADLERELERKKVEYKTSDFVRWAEDARGEIVEDTGQDTVNRFIKEEFMVDGQRTSYLYNIAQMRMQDDKHKKGSFIKKWWPRFWTSEKPVPFQDAKQYWLKVWNAKVVAEGIEIAVKRRRKYARQWSSMSSIRIIVDVDNPIDDLIYGVSCRELGWTKFGQVKWGPYGNYVLFGKSVYMDEFSDLRSRYGDQGGITVELLDNKKRVVAKKFLTFSDMMSPQGANKKEDKEGIWTEFRVPVVFAWKPELLRKLEIKLNPKTRLEMLQLQFGGESVTLKRRPESGELPENVLPIENHVSAGSVDFLSILKAAGLDSSDAVSCLYGTTEVDVDCTFKTMQPKTDSGEDAVEQMSVHSYETSIKEIDPELSIDLDFIPKKKPEFTDYKKMQRAVKQVCREFVASPGTQPKEYYKFQQKLPRNVSLSLMREAFTEPAKKRIELEFAKPVARFVESVKDIEARFLKVHEEASYNLEKETRAFGSAARGVSIPIPAYYSILMDDANVLKGKIKKTQTKLRQLQQEMEDVKNKQITALKSTREELVNLRMNELGLPSWQLESQERRLKAREELLEDDLFALDGYERTIKARLTDYDARLEQCSNSAAAGTFYLSKIEGLHKELLALHEEKEALMQEAIRQPAYVSELVSHFNNFNSWASGAAGTHSPFTSLDLLYGFLTGREVNLKQPKKRDIPMMINAIEQQIKAAISPEADVLTALDNVREKLNEYQTAALTRSNGIRPLDALFVNDLTKSDLKAYMKKNRGRLGKEIVSKRVRQTQQKWKAAKKLPAGSGRNPGESLWILSAAGSMDTFLTLTEPEAMAKGDGKARAWLAKYKNWGEQVTNIQPASHLQDTLSLIKVNEELAREIQQISGSPWPDRYRAQWAYGRIDIGEKWVASMVKAWIGAMDKIDKKMWEDINNLTSLSPAKQAEEKKRLKEIAGSSFWAALGLQPLRKTRMGRSFYIGCYEGRYISEAYLPGHQKWDQLQAAWQKELEPEKFKEEVENNNDETVNGNPDDEHVPPALDAHEAYEKYIKAYTKMTSLGGAEGKGDSPEAKAAYQEYLKAKEAYEATQK